MLSRRQVLRKIILYVLVAAALAVSTGPGPFRPTTEAPPMALAVAQAPRVMVVGDSISQGSAGDFTWRYRFYQHLVASGVAPDMVGPRADLYDNVTNQQGAGSYADPDFDADHDAEWGRMLAQADPAVEGEVQAANPDILLVLLGINDLTFRTDAPQTEALLRSFIAHARAGRADVKIVLGTLLATQKSVDEPPFAATLADYNIRLRQVAASLTTAGSPIVVAETARDVVVADDLYDGTHPNARGEVKIAAGFADALAAQFAIGAAYPRPLPTVPLGPQTPPHLVASPRDGGAELTWTASPGATGYWVWQRNTGAGPEFTRLPIPLPFSSSPWTAGLMTNGVTYEFKLQAAKGSADGVFSNVVSVTPDGPAPGPATSLTVANGNSQATLTWTLATNATAYNVYQRNLTAGETTFTKLPYPVPGPTWTAGLLTNGATYEYKLESLNGLIIGATSTTITANPTGPTPAAPTGLTVANGNSQATLTWTLATNATAYNIYQRNLTAGETTFTKLPYPVPGPTWTAGLLTNGATYEYKLESLNGLIIGATSTTITANPTGPTPAAPTGLTVANGNSQATLTWTLATNATAYNIYQRNLTAGETTFTKLPYPVPGPTWTAGLLTNGATYEYKLESLNGLIIGATSTTITANPTGPTPAAPTGLTVANGNSQATLTWTLATNATAYNIYQRNLTAGETTFTKLPYPVPGPTWTAGLLTNGATYEYKLESLNGLIIGATSTTITANPTGPAPGTPVLTALPGNRKVALSWTSPANATAFFVDMRNVTAGENSFTRLPYPVSDDAFTVDLLTNGATYEFRVQAYNGLIAGGTSAPVQAHPTGPGAPGPNNLQARPGDRKAILTWNEADQATGYSVWMRNVSAGESSFTRLPYPVSGATWTAGLLTNGMTYEFKLQSVDGLQPGGYSNTTSVVPLGPTPQAPGDLAVRPGLGEAKLTWTATNTTSFLVQMRDVTLNETTFTELPFPVSGGSWTAGLLKPGHRYEFKLVGVSGWQRGTATSAVGVDLPLPPVVTGVVVTPGPYSATVSWKAVPGVTEYWIYMKYRRDTGDLVLDQLPPPRSSMTKVQWGLTGTSWTQLYLMVPARYWYEVVAVKNGVPSADTPAIDGINFTFPLMENVYHYEARGAIASGAPAEDKKVLVHVGASGSDRGIVVARAFIRDDNAFDYAIGDHRSYSDSLSVTSKLSVMWDTGTGEVSVFLHRSCVGLQYSGDIIPTQYCESALPIVLGPIPNIDDGTAVSYNYVQVQRSGGTLTVRWKVTNAVTADANLGPPWHIDGRIDLIPDGDGLDTHLIADRFPAYEVFRYPTFTMIGFPKVDWLGYRDQTNITELDKPASYQSDCWGVWPYNRTAPMAC